MTQTVTQSVASGDRVLAWLIDELMKRLADGRSDELPDFFAEHAEHAEQLRQLMPALEALVQIRDATNSAQIACRAGDLVRRAGDVSPPMTTTSDSTVDPDKRTLGDFRIIREIGRGGMGVVYEAEQLSLSRRVALKVLPFAAMLDERQLQRFKNEARAAATLHHPSIVPVFSVGCERGVHFYAMQFIEGQSLAEVIEGLRSPPPAPGFAGGSNNDERHLHHNPRAEPGAESGKGDDDPHSPFPIRHSPFADTSPIAALSTIRTTKPRDYFRTIAELGIQAAEALDYAHSLGIVHRDIKPANLLLEANNSSPFGRGQGEGNSALRIPNSKLWVADFGLARLPTDAGMTMTGDLVGTLRYMSPEQALAKRVVVDHRTDIYGLGITLYELLTLRPAYDSDDRQELLRRIAFEEPTPPRRLNAAIPTDLETIVLKAMSKNAHDRYSTAEDFAADLGRYVEHKPIKAKRVSAIGRFWRWARRNKAIAALVGLAFVSLASLALLAGFAYFRTSALLADRSAALFQVAQKHDVAQLNLYRAHIRVAQRDSELGQMKRMREVLEQHVPKPGEPDNRGWEWYFLRSRPFADQEQILQFPNAVNNVAVSNDGSMFAVAAAEVSIWDTPTRRRIATIPVNDARFVEFSPNGEQLVVAQVPGAVTVWSRDAVPIASLPVSLREQEVEAVAWSPTGKLLAVRDSLAGRIVLCDHLGTIVSSIPFDSKKHAYCLAWSPDGVKLAAGGKSGHFDVVLWHVDQGNLLREIEFDPEYDVFTLSWSPDGEQLACGTYTCSTVLFDANTYEISRRLTSFSPVEDIDWSSDGKRLILALRGQAVEIWDPIDGRRIEILLGHEGRLSGAKLSEPHQLLITGGRDQTVRIWPRQEANSPKPDGRNAIPPTLVGGTNDGRAIYRDKPTSIAVGQKDSAPRIQFNAEIRETNFNGRSGVLTVLLARGEVKTYRLDAERFLPLSSWATELDSMSLSPSGECVVMSSRESMRDVEVFRSDSGVKTAVIPAESARIFTVRWSPMEKLVAAADGRGLVRLFETEHWREVARYTGHVKGQYVNCVAWSPDGSRLATGGWDETIRIWNARDATTIRVIEGHNAQIQEIDWSPDGRRIASYAADRTLRIWDADSGDELLLLQGFQRSLSWSSDGQKLATAKDGQLHVLDASRAYELETRRQMTLSHASTPD